MTDELDPTTFPAWLAAVSAHRLDGEPAPRTYPGYPRQPLAAHKPRRFGMTLERALATRRTPATLSRSIDDKQLSSILALSHGITATAARGPVPSAGGLQALELYAVAWSVTGVPAGWYHYDRAAHELARLVDGATRADAAELIPALAAIDGGALAWIAVGDRGRVEPRYTKRAHRFLLLEAGHLMQNLCLASIACGCATVPLGGFLERAIAHRLQLPRTDDVLAAGAAG